MKNSIFKAQSLWALSVGVCGLLSFAACSDDPYDFDGVVLGVESKVGKASAADAKMMEVPALQTSDLFVTH
ncbi:MAG: hypothetical protein IJS20_03900, partial [Bacteroidales bacterium]|nr:hypothetical protein [Bacteroidales bacterium]